MKEQIDEDWTENDSERLRKLGKCVGVSDEILNSEIEGETDEEFKEVVSPQIDEEWTESYSERPRKLGNCVGVSDEILNAGIEDENDEEFEELVSHVK